MSSHLATVSSLCRFPRTQFAGSWLRLEGSLAAVITLAPVIPLFPARTFRAVETRRQPPARP